MLINVNTVPGGRNLRNCFSLVVLVLLLSFVVAMGMATFAAVLGCHTFNSVALIPVVENFGPLWLKPTNLSLLERLQITLLKVLMVI